MARLVVVIGPVSTRNFSFVALKMLSGNLLHIENRKCYLWNRKQERCALHSYIQATETGPINRFSQHNSFRLLSFVTYFPLQSSGSRRGNCFIAFATIMGYLVYARTRMEIQE